LHRSQKELEGHGAGVGETVIDQHRKMNIIKTTLANDLHLPMDQPAESVPSTKDARKKNN